MNMKNLQQKIKNTGLVLSLAFGFLILSGVTANAQYRDNDDYNRREQRQQRQEEQRRNSNNGYYGNNGGYGNNGYGNNGYYNDIYRIAQQNGYNDGVNKGMEDAREGHRNPQGTSLYKNGLNGYDSRLRNKDAYRQAYRQAFLQGFDDGYNRNYNRNNRNNRNRYGSGNSVRRIILGY